MRWKWAEENQVVLPSLEPGGWSAHGQPQDWVGRVVTFVTEQGKQSIYCILIRIL